jgi:hypothetical protein
MALGWIMPLAGYSGTPAEDVEPIRDQIEAEAESRPQRPQKPKARPAPAATSDDESRWQTAINAIHDAERLVGMKETPEATLRQQGLEWCRRYYAELRSRLEAMEV